VWNRYCDVAGGGFVDDNILNNNQACGPPFQQSYRALTCDTVQAYIDVTNISQYPPIFYRCYWRRKTLDWGYDVVSFEWAATNQWIVNQLPGTNLIPLLCVTNHTT
jgi:hypothetical protein